VKVHPRAGLVQQEESACGRVAPVPLRQHLPSSDALADVVADVDGAAYHPAADPKAQPGFDAWPHLGRALIRAAGAVCSDHWGLFSDTCKPCQNQPVTVNHYENFPVASVLCPPAIRPAVVAVYHFARTADDVADEGSATAAERLITLAAYRRDLDVVLAGCPDSGRWPKVFPALARVVAKFELPTQPLHDLLSAFEQDVANAPYANRDALLGYCGRSANPVGRLLLHLYGAQDTVSIAQSDAVCTALQLINFWQDLSVDGPRGRPYVPESDRIAHGVETEDLRTCRDTAAAQALVASLCDWARGLMHEGAPLALRIPGRAGWELRLVVQGGLRILDKIAAMDHAALTRRPTLSALDAPVLLWRALRMKTAAA